MNKRTRISIITMGTVILGVLIGCMGGTFFNNEGEKKKVAKGESIDEVVNAEGVMMDSMHKMLHQKVIADKKSGFILMSPDNIKKLRHMLDQSDKMPNKEKYADILERWEKGDFSQAVGEHNYIWEREGGENVGETGGEAIRLATQKEEKAYLKEQSEKENK
ncbi:DUF6241 domain-containing protein [Bacillus sp. TL12]|uniref:DUF6241 domain-containing protein n=1 Tax=Bacillus sp. TL12 TaxID=2894756 RepID=UPI001F51602F|nr:DUF6241 domain-containing protein [Bacillus sp. TL12]MCI0768088.1 DUF6241 domain-containing protein [Bacillus sp. TL12]